MEQAKNIKLYPSVHHLNHAPNGEPTYVNIP